MGLHKAEIFFFVLLFLLGFAGISSFLAWSAASELHAIHPETIATIKYNYMAMVLTGLSIACSVLLSTRQSRSAWPNAAGCAT